MRLGPMSGGAGLPHVANARAADLVDRNVRVPEAEPPGRCSAPPVSRRALNSALRVVDRPSEAIGERRAAVAERLRYAKSYSAESNSAACEPMNIVGAWVWPRTRTGMIDASAMRKP